MVSWPTFAWIALTNRCNLRCTHCPRILYQPQGLPSPREISWEIIQKIRVDLFPHLRRIQFGGNNLGEQLFASNWDRCLEVARDGNRAIALVTNGLLLNPERIANLVKAGAEINFSLEGVTAETYEAVRGAKFKRFIGIVQETCRQKILSNGTGAQVILGFTAMRRNVHEILPLISLAADLGIDRITITHFAPLTESQRYESLFYHQELAQEVFSQAAHLARELNMPLGLPQSFREMEREEDGRPNGRIIPCYVPWTSVSINEAGDVIPCCATSAVMGNLTSSTFSEIWLGSKYKRLRETVNSPYPPSFCRDCLLRGLEVGANKPVTLRSDVNFLLAAIGIEPPKSSSSWVSQVKDRIVKTLALRKAKPYLVESYRQCWPYYESLLKQIDRARRRVQSKNPVPHPRGQRRLGPRVYDNNKPKVKANHEGNLDLP